MVWTHLYALSPWLAWLLAGACALAGWPVHAAGGQEPDLRLTADGRNVVDAQSRLAWPRCVEGMQWNGRTCVGEPRLMTYAEARDWAAQRARADGVPWRLPRVPELRRWATIGGQVPARSVQYFPAAPTGWYWTLTASIQNDDTNPYNYGSVMEGRTANRGTTVGVQQGWALNMATGEAEGNVSRRSRLLVRLVANL